MTKPDGIDEAVWQTAERVAYDIDTDGYGSVCYQDAQISIAAAISQAIATELQWLEAELRRKKYGPELGIDAEMEAFNDGLTVAILEIRSRYDIASAIRKGG